MGQLSTWWADFWWGLTYDFHLLAAWWQQRLRARFLRSVEKAEHIILVGTAYRCRVWCAANEVNPLDRRVICITSNDNVERLRGLKLHDDDTIVVHFDDDQHLDHAAVSDIIRRCGLKVR